MTHGIQSGSDNVAFPKPGTNIVTTDKKNKSAMKKILTLLMLTAAFAVNAQTPTPESDTVKDQSTQIDPEPKQQPTGLHYIDESVRITAEELPAVVLDSLKKIEPQTWEKSVVYKQKNDNNYLVEIRDGGQERTYWFDKTGKRITSSDQQPRRNKE